jgi:hypothetical protein
MKDYKFNPTEYGFVPVDNYPELSYLYPMGTGKWFIKVTAYMGRGKSSLAYWYHTIYVSNDGVNEDRVEVMRSVHDTRKPASYDYQHKPTTVYEGVISSHKFAKSLLMHLFATRNSSVKERGKETLEMESINIHNLK